MATGKVEVRGRRSIIEMLTVPRPITRLLLLVMLGIAGEVAWKILTVPLLAYVSGVMASFCLLCAGAVWAMRDKADVLRDGDHLTAREFKQSSLAAKRLRQRSTWRAAYVAFSALLAVSPAVSQQFSSAVWEWMMIAAGIGVAEAAYSFLLVNAWEEQLMAVRDESLLKAKQADAQNALINRLSGPSQSSTVSDSSWIQVVPVANHQYRQQ